MAGTVIEPNEAGTDAELVAGAIAELNNLKHFERDRSIPKECFLSLIFELLNTFFRSSILLEVHHVQLSW